MTTVTRIERRKRGLFGWIFLILFLGFNAIMLFAFLAGLAGGGEHIASASSDAEQAGAAIGTAIGAGMLLSIWMMGAVILGLFVLLTPGKKIIVETNGG